MPKAIRDQLARPFSPEEIGNDVYNASDNFRPRYPHWSVLFNRLNDIFDGNWSDELISYSTSPDGTQIIAHVQLQVVYKDAAGETHRVIHAGIGNAQINMVNMVMRNYGYDVKAAHSDGLWKAANKLGIGLDLYQHTESPFQGLQQVQAVPQQASQPAPAHLVGHVVACMNHYGVRPERWLPVFGLQRPEDISIADASDILTGRWHKVGHLIPPGAVPPQGLVVSNAK